jgi:hypothetical protein
MAGLYMMAVCGVMAFEVTAFCVLPYTSNIIDDEVFG